jgi:DNA-binding transcriptional regulator LsrR (DeoR family)
MTRASPRIVAPTPPPRQAEALRYVRDYMKHFGEAPTREEIGHRLGITRVSAHLLVVKLRDAGYVAVWPRRHRGLRLTLKGRIAPC